jgi:hypothetical protein
MADKLSKLEGNKFYISNNGGKDWEYVKDLTPAEVNQYEYTKAEKQAGYGEKEAYGVKGLTRLNMLRKRVGLPELTPASNSASDINKTVRSGIKELQEHSADKYKNVVYDYMINKNPKPNNKLIKAWQTANKSSATPSIADVQKSVNEGKLSKDDVVGAYKDQQWWFRAIAPERVYKPKDEYEKLMQRQGFVEQDGKKYWQDTADKPYEYTEYYTDEDGKPTTTPDKITTPGPGTTVTTTVDDKKKKTEGDVPGIKTQKVGYKTVEQRAPWWLQDIVGVAGAFGDLNRIKRYPPWQATPNVHLPGATFYDPTRELAANAEQANIQTQGLAAFTGPQALSARSAQIQGQALKNAADVMGRYNNLNVGLANELEQNRANILNTASQNQANLDTQLWDKYTIMNQQFDNSKAQARQELRKHYINAITNRAKTQALNTLYPNFQVDSSTGGYVYATDLNYTPTYTGQSDGSVEKQLWKQASEIDPANTLEIWKQLMRTKYKKSSAPDYPYQGYEAES